MEAMSISGDQYVISASGYEAHIASVGASLRALTFEGRDLVVPFDADEIRPASRGLTLAPWPNRIVDGRYVFEGVEFQLPLTEPARRHALHGLASWAQYELVAADDASVTLSTTVQAQAGYPWRVRIETTFAVSADGLTQRVRATNESDTPAPWGTGPHPYLVAPTGVLDEWTLQLPASQVLEVTPDRLSPIDLAAVDTDAARFDFRAARVIGDAAIDHAFTGLSRDANGVATVSVTDADGRGVAMRFGATLPWVQVHTADLPGGAANPNDRLGLAVEPMTCAPDAFNAERYAYDAGRIALSPGETHAGVEWTISAL